MPMECPGRRVFQEDVENAAKRIRNPDLLKNKTILITGATGLIGGALVRTLLCANRLLGLNMKILAPVRSMHRAQEALKGVFERSDLCVFEADIENGIDFPGDVHYIVHAASVTQSKMIVTRPVETIAFTLNSTMNLLKFARDKEISGMVYLSSMEAFGIPDPALERVTEKELGYLDLVSVRSSYPESKRMAENLCACFHHEYGVPVCAARLAQTFGAGVSKTETRAFMQFAKSALEGRDIVLHTKGESYGNYVYLSDAVEAILLLMTKGARGEIYTVSNEDACVRIRDLALIAAKTLSDPEVRVVFDIPDDPMTYGYAPDVKMHLSNKKIRSLGWKPTVDLPGMFMRLSDDLRDIE